jgi:hypothetical protein
MPGSSKTDSDIRIGGLMVRKRLMRPADSGFQDCPGGYRQSASVEGRICAVVRRSEGDDRRRCADTTLSVSIDAILGSATGLLTAMGAACTDAADRPIAYHPISNLRECTGI